MPQTKSKRPPADASPVPDAALQVFPEVVLEQHMGFLGKTGSGKTSTAKLAIEQIVSAGGRVCILDPIKSDHWGLTSSADGKRPGLPFHILGGPYGHVPLHQSAGAAIGEIVANGSLPLSILDMKEFAPGGHYKFFVDFAPMLLRKIRGVMWLVIEEAHLFAPKERSGMGDENMAVHYAKTLSTAGRSAGIRLMVITQRTQALHNALLGSCDAIMAHRLTAPADQAPVLKWLQGNANKEVAMKVAESLASLKKGEAWICSGEGIFERRQFPKIATYDNTATPTGNEDRPEVRTAPVDLEKLTAIVGAAVEEAKANDPALLRKRIAELEREVKAKSAAAAPAGLDAATVNQAIEAAAAAARRQALHEVRDAITGVVQLRGLIGPIGAALQDLDHRLEQQVLVVDAIKNLAPRSPNPGLAAPALSNGAAKPAAVVKPPRPPSPVPNGEIDGGLPRMHRKFLTVLAQRGAMSKGTLLLHAGYAASGKVSVAFAEMVESGLIVSDKGHVSITDSGRSVLGPVDPLPTGQELREATLAELGAMPAALLRAWFGAYPGLLSKGEALDVAGYAASGKVSTALAKLKGRGFIVKENGRFKASPEFFS